jgi:hypothetical protein
VVIVVGIIEVVGLEVVLIFCVVGIFSVVEGIVVGGFVVVVIHVVTSDT